MELFQVDEAGRLFISAALKEWSGVELYAVDTVIDLEGGLDSCIPIVPNHCLYIYFHIEDDEQRLPSMKRLRPIARLAASMIDDGHRVLAHCGMGFNRSALVAGRILNNLGMSGADAVERLRERRPGALFNDVFAEHLKSLPAPVVTIVQET